MAEALEDLKQRKEGKTKTQSVRPDTTAKHDNGILFSLNQSSY